MSNDRSLCVRSQVLILVYPKPNMLAQRVRPFGSTHKPNVTHSNKRVAYKTYLARCPTLRTYCSSTRKAGPADPAPSYRDIDSQPLNSVVMALFRRKMVAALGSDSPLPGYDGIIDLTRRLNSKFRTAAETQEATRGILRALFPSWLPGAFKVLFSRPLPEFSCRLNALATALTCQWLMGPCKVNDVEIDGGAVGAGQGVLVERCRYLEQAGCAAVCVNSCKLPTQTFFEQDMGLRLTMTPNYEDFSCQFAFGKTPLPEEKDEAFTTPCFQQCPSKKGRAGRSVCGGIQLQALPRD